MFELAPRQRFHVLPPVFGRRHTYWDSHSEVDLQTAAKPERASDQATALVEGRDAVEVGRAQLELGRREVLAKS